jgi:hypothetical protein
MRIKTALRAAIISVVAVVASAQSYFPSLHNWEPRKPEQVGLDSRKLEEAIAYAKANETKGPRDLELNHYTGNAREPYGEAIGPFKSRGELTGVIVRHGYLVAEWGNCFADMTFSRPRVSSPRSWIGARSGLIHDGGSGEELWTTGNRVRAHRRSPGITFVKPAIGRTPWVNPTGRIGPGAA